MRCPRCNRESKDGTVFCPGCGAPLSLRPEPAAPALDTTLDLDRRAAAAVREPPAPSDPRPRPGPPPPARPAVPAARAAPASAPRPAAAPAAPNPGPRAAPAPGRTAAPAAPSPEPRPPPTPAAKPEPRPARAVPPRAAEPPLPRAPEPPLPPPEPSRREMPLSQMPRERRLDLDPEPPPPERRAVLAPEAQPEPSGTLEVAVEPLEVHLRRAPSWKRVLAWLLDGVPFAALFALALRVALDRLPHAAPLDVWASIDLAAAEVAGVTGPLFAGTVVLFVAYHVLAHGLSGATLGKRIVGIRVVGPDGRRPGLGRAAIRGILGAVSLALLGLGVLLALFTRSGRALHDLLARTWVVEAP